MIGEILDEVVIKNQEALAYRIIDGQAIIINLEQDTFNILDSVGTRIWELIGVVTTGKSIIEQLYEEFEINYEKLEKDCSEFIEQMVDKDLLRLSSFLSSANLINSPINSIKTDGDLFGKLREKAIKKKIPIICHFDLTYHCNLNCVHCYIKLTHQPELTTFEIKDVLVQLAGAEVLYLTLSGGEILTRKDFFEIAAFARKLNFALRILTNGMFIDEQVADKIASLNPELVSISIYSLNPETHDKITGLIDSFQKSMAAVEMLKYRGVKIKLATIVMKKKLQGSGNNENIG